MITSSDGMRIHLVIGYSPKAAKTTRWGTVPASWEVALLSQEGAITVLFWGDLIKALLLDEWS